MVKVPSTRGGFVNVEIKGIAEVIRNLQATNKKLISNTEIGMVQVANFIQQEVQESIIGNRAEPKSVDTGRFGNSIELKKESDLAFVIQPDNSKYPNGTPVRKVAALLEFGTSKTSPRRHFRNTVARNRKKAIDLMDKFVS